MLTILFLTAHWVVPSFADRLGLTINAMLYSMSTYLLFQLTSTVGTHKQTHLTPSLRAYVCVISRLWY